MHRARMCRRERGEGSACARSALVVVMVVMVVLRAPLPQALEWCDWWIANMDHRCSGTLADLTYDESKVYEDDGSLMGVVSNNGAVVADDGDEADDGDLIGGADAPGADWDDDEE